MFKRLRRCFKNIRTFFKPKNNKKQNVEEPIENDEELVEEFKVEEVVDEIVKVKDEEWDVSSSFKKKRRKLQVYAEGPSDPGIYVEGSTTSSKSSLSDPTKILPVPGTILIIVQEAKIKLEYTAEPTTANTVVIHTKVQLDEQENRLTEGKVESDSRNLNVAADLSIGFLDTLADPIDTASNAKAELTVVEETKKRSGSKVKSRRCRFRRTLCKLFRCNKKESMTDSASSSDQPSLEELTENEEQTKKEIESVIKLKEIEEKAEAKTQELVEAIDKDTEEESNHIKDIEEQIEEKFVSVTLESEVENAEDREGTENEIIFTEVIECPSVSSISDAVQFSVESMKDRVSSPDQLSLEELTETEEQTKEESGIKLKEIEEKAEVQIQELLEDITEDTDEEFDLIKVIAEQIDEKSVLSSFESEESMTDSVSSSDQLSVEELPEIEEQTKEEIESGLKLKETEENAEIQIQEFIEAIAKDTDKESDHIKDIAEQIEEKSVSSTLESEVENPEEHIAETEPAPSLAAGCTVPVAEQEYQKTDKQEDSDSKTPDVAVELTKSLTDDESDPINITPSPGIMLIMVQESKTGAKISISETFEEIVKESGEVLSLQAEHLPQESQIICSTSAPENSLIAAHPAQKEELAERIDSEGACAPQEPQDSTDQQMSWNSLEDFDFCKWIAKGSYGEVFLAEHKKTSKMVAIKRMEKTAIFNTETTECLFVEKSILKMARDEKTPFLVGLVCTFQREHNVYLAMEFGVGGDLSSQLNNGALPLNSTLFYSACIVLGIKFLHDRSIVHRDLKPDNVLIDSRGYAKLADFGLCKTGIGYGDEMKYPCGTAQYMPPEMFTTKIYNRTTDWWALGVVIFQMAVGKLPFTGNRQQLRENIVNKQPNYPGWLDYNTNGIIRALLNKDNKARLGSLKYDSEQVMRYRYFKPMNWKALMKRELKAPFIPGPYVKSTAATEGQKAGDAATPPEFMWPVHLEVQEAFREFDELPKAP